MQLLRKTNRKRIGFLIIVGILMLAAALRFYKLDETILFTSDQGLDMVSIFLLKKTGNIPLIGPFLSMPGVYTPPTYYFINWIIYSLTHSVTKLVYAYAILNIVTIIILIKLTYNMMGMRTAIIIGLLLAVSDTMIDHSRTFWQPYPIQLFLALSLMFFWWTYRTKHVLFLWAGILCYQVALSIYPSPILLMPFVCYHLFRWYHRDTHASISVSILLTLLTFGTSFAAVFSPQLVFEITHGFPTIAGILSPDTSGHIMHPVVSLIQNGHMVITSFFATDRMPHRIMIISTISICFLYAALITLTRRDKPHQSDEFFPFWAFALGFCAFLLYPYEAHHHRNTALLPFLFILTARLIDLALHKNQVTKVLALITLLVFIGFNLNGAMWYWTGGAPNQIEQTKRVAYFIQSDMNKRGVPDSSAGFFYKIPNDPDNGSYGIYRILFWLLRDAGLSFSLNAKAIHLPHDYSTPVLKPYMYIICRGFSQQSISDLCIHPVIRSETYRELTRNYVNNITVVVLSREIISGVPYTTHE